MSQWTPEASDTRFIAPRRSEVRVGSTAVQLELPMNLSLTLLLHYSVTQRPATLLQFVFKTLAAFLIFRFLISSHRRLLTCWLWTLWASGQRRSPEPRHTGRRASHWGCSSGSCQRFWSCRLQTLSAWCTRASVAFPPWWKGLRKGDTHMLILWMNNENHTHLVVNATSHWQKQEINIWLPKPPLLLRSACLRL